MRAFVVISGEQIAGVLSYALEGESLIIVMLSVLPGYQGLGAGRMLLDAARDIAHAEKKSTVLVSTSNDDIPALYFYQKNGFLIYQVIPNSIAEHHGGIEVGFAGIPCRDDLRLRLELADF